VDSTRQTSTEVERRLKVEVTALETLLATHGLPAKDDTLTKVRKQLAGISALVDFWWQTVEHDLEDIALTASWKDWVDECLLPLMYWQEQLSRTRCPGQKPRSPSRSRSSKRLSRGILVRVDSGPRCWPTGRGGQPIMPRPSNALLRRLKGEMVTCHRCSTIIAAYPSAATRCGRRCTTSIVAPRMERHPLRGFSDGSSPISSRAC